MAWVESTSSSPEKTSLAVISNSWVAIDPKGIVGPPEAEVAAFLRNPKGQLPATPDGVSSLARRTSLISEYLGYEKGRVSGWGHVLAAVAAVWAMEDEGPAEALLWLDCSTMLRQVYEHFEP